MRWRRCCELWTGAPEQLRERYRSSLTTLGQRVRVTLADREVEGEAIDVTADGALVVRVGEDELVVSAGDVVHLRPA